MDKKVGIFLTGGGARGSFHIGFFKALEEYGIKPDFVCGNSIGALISGAASYLDSKEMKECWDQVTMEKVLSIDSNILKNLSISEKNKKIDQELINMFKKDPKLLDSQPIGELLNKILDAKKMISSNLDFGFTTTKLPSFKFIKTYKEQMNEDNIMEYILSSMFLPVFRPKRLIDGHYYLDVSDFRKYPLDMLINKNCNEIYIVDLTLNPNKMVKSIEVFNECDDVNVITMNEHSSILDFTRETSDYKFNDGYETTMKVLSKVKK